MSQDAVSGGVETPPPTTPLKQKKKLLNGPHFCFTYPNGSVYEGAFKDGKLHGFGVYKYMPSGDRYEGEWKADMKHGHGRYTFAGGDAYIGSWYMGKKHGKGRFLFATGDEYYGTWKTDVMDGHGVFRLDRTGDQYEGYWEQGVRQGLGILRTGSGNIYDGHWASGKEDGFGVLQEVNGKLYCGTWKGGFKDGKGIEQDKGVIFLVEYLGGYLISKQPHQAGNPTGDEDWDTALQHVRAWEAPPPLSLLPTGRHEELDAEGIEALRRTLENWRTSYLALYDRMCAHAAAGKPLSEVLSVEQLSVVELRNYVDLVKGRVQLLEGALGEKMLQGRRNLDLLNERDATIQDLKLQLARVRGERRRSVRHRDSMSGVPLSLQGESDLTTLEGNTMEQHAAAATLVNDLRQQIVALTQVNHTQKQRITVLSSENEKLSSAASDMEEQVKDLAARLESVEACSTQVATKPCNGGTAVGDVLTEPQIRIQLRAANEQNAELLVQKSQLERALTETQADAVTLRKRVRELQLARESATSMLTALQEANTLSSNGADAKSASLPALIPAPPPDWKKDPEAKAPKRTISINEALLEKEKQVAELQNENAELARLIEEYRFQVESAAANTESADRHRRQRSTETSRVNADVDKADADAKKARKKLKKVVEERNNMAMELFSTQCSLSRLNRVAAMIKGRVTIAVAVGAGKEKTATDGSVLSVSDADPSQIVFPDIPKTFNFDICFPLSTGLDNVYLELKSPLLFAAQGFQAGFVGLGRGIQRTNNVLLDLLPLLVEGLKGECSMYEELHSPFRVAFRVGAVEVDVTGATDCLSGKSLDGVVEKDECGYVRPRGVDFVDCGSEGLVELLKRITKCRSEDGRLCHLWVQIQVLIRHRMQQTQRCGRLTLLDLTSLSSADDFVNSDAANTRYMKRSLRQVDDLLFALQSGANKLPYSDSTECALLRDLLGGNSMTTVLGSVASGPREIQEQLLSHLASLESIGKINNGPYLQDYEGADELRWREIVCAVSSAEQAQPLLDPVEDVVS